MSWVYSHLRIDILSDLVGQRNVRCGQWALAGGFEKVFFIDERLNFGTATAHARHSPQLVVIWLRLWNPTLNLRSV